MTSENTPLDHTETLARAGTLIASAKKHTATGDLEGAVEALADASQLYAETLGQDAPQCADVLYLYGEALLRNAIAKSSLMGEGKGASSAEDKEEEEDNSEDKGKDPAAPEEQEQDQDDDDENDNEEPEDPIEEDIQIAWETLDLARIGYSKMGPDGELKMANVLLALGDVSLEQGQWLQAIEDFSSACTIKSSRLSPEDRELAEANYKLGLAHEFAKQFDHALTAQHKALAVLKARLASLKAVEGDQVTENTTLEIEDIEALMPEFHAKIDDIHIQIEEAKQTNADAAAAAALATTTTTPGESEQPSLLAFSSGSASSSASAAIVNDISGLVKSKKTAVAASSASGSASVSAAASPLKGKVEVETTAAAAGIKRKAEEGDASAAVEEGAKKAKDC
ncbi:hypothetical protein HDU98_001703 [Podochytrium sp. JEL0797]|nr:hypothetical protein HDU98_001703 [Podochytrium sp. JEL0797]